MSVLKAKEKIVWRKKKDLLVILNTESGSYYTLNEVAQDLWMNHIVDGKDLEASVEKIADSYDGSPATEQIKDDCLKIIDEWKDSDMVELVE